MPRTAPWPPYRTVRDLVLEHAGRPAVVMGGGTTLAKYIEQAPLNALYLSVNDHGLRLFKDHPELNRRVDYVVCADGIEERVRRDVGFKDLPGPARDGTPWNVPVVARHMWGDYRLTYMPAPNSGMAAAWLARLMGCAPIILMGMDLWEGATYHDAPKAKSTGKSAHPTKHLERWVTLLARYPAQYRALGCSPLLRTKCAHYDPTEVPAPVLDRDRLNRDLQSTTVRTLKEVRVSHRTFAAGIEVELNKAEATKHIGLGKCIPVARPGEG